MSGNCGKHHMDANNTTDKRKTRNVLGESRHSISVKTIPLFIESVSGHGKTHGLKSDRIKEVESALTEALNNIVEFACGPEGLEVTVTCSADAHQTFIIEITDEGKPYNMLLEADPLFSGSSTAQKLPSVRLMKRLIKNVDYKRHEGKNFLTLTVMPDFKAYEEEQKGR